MLHIYTLRTYFKSHLIYLNVYYTMYLLIDVSVYCVYEWRVHHSMCYESQRTTLDLVLSSCVGPRGRTQVIRLSAKYFDLPSHAACQSTGYVTQCSKQLFT